MSFNSANRFSTVTTPAIASARLEKSIAASMFSARMRSSFSTHISSRLAATLCVLSRINLNAQNRGKSRHMEHRQLRQGLAPLSYQPPGAFRRLCGRPIVVWNSCGREKAAIEVELRDERDRVLSAAASFTQALSDRSPRCLEVCPSALRHLSRRNRLRRIGGRWPLPRAEGKTTHPQNLGDIDSAKVGEGLRVAVMTGVPRLPEQQID